MTIETPLCSSNDDELEWASHTVALNAWRGRWLQVFAGVEAAVTETLVAWRENPAFKDAVPLRQLSGQRFNDLAAMIGEGGPLAENGKQAAQALACFRVHEDLRNMLAHGVAKIALERNGDWIAVFRMTAIRSGQPVTIQTVVEQADSRRKIQELQRSGQSLTARLTNLRNTRCTQSIGT